MRVLIVEDDAEKLRRIMNVLIRSGISSELITETRSSQQAKTLLRQQFFDLLLLDLNIPQRVEEEPRQGEGVALLRELTERDRYKKPGSVIGVTAFDSELNNAQAVFDAALIPIFLYERESSAWERPLQSWIEYREATINMVANPGEGEYVYDIAIITALDIPELSAIRDLDWNWKAVNYDTDDTTYFEGFTRKSDGLRVVAASSPFMGMPSASILATKMIQRYRPRYLIHAGIAAGMKGQAEIGDVLVADPSWDWGSGKFILEDNSIEFIAAPYQIRIREELRSKVRRLADQENVLSRIRSQWKAAKPSSVLSVRIGPVASGASVLADGKIKEQIKDQHRKLLGIEMETYGIMASAEFCVKPRPMAISLKSVCDFADGTKNDEFQTYAAYTSARVIEALVQEYLS